VGRSRFMTAITGSLLAGRFPTGRFRFAQLRGRRLVIAVEGVVASTTRWLLSRAHPFRGVADSAVRERGRRERFHSSVTQSGIERHVAPVIEATSEKVDTRDFTPEQLGSESDDSISSRA